MIGQLKQRWSKRQRILHWVMFPLVMMMIALGIYSNTLLSSESYKSIILFSHQVLGCIVLLLAAIRIIWYSNSKPQSKRLDESPWLEHTAKLTHSSLRLIILILPVLGVTLSISDPFIWPLVTDSADVSDRRADIAELSHSLHYLGAWLLAAILALHVIGAVRYNMKNK